MRFQSKLILLIGSLLLIVIAILGYAFQYMAAEMVKQQIGTRVLNVAETVASIPDIKQALSQPNPTKIIQPIAEDIRRKTQAEFVVVGNTQGVRFSHPIPSEIGKKMVGDDDQEVLQGKTQITEAVGTLGPSLRGKAPIFNDQRKLIGIVSVGFLTQDVEAKILAYRHRIILLGLAALIVGVAGTLWIAQSVKKATFGLEPDEIGRLYQEKLALLESIREGILAINAKGLVTMANRTAVQMLGFAEGDDLIGQPLADIALGLRLLSVVQTAKAEFDQELFLAERVLVVNVLPILDTQRQVIGAVASLRNKSELYRLAEELSNVKEYAEALRAQTHEYNNKLYMISGLIQLESYHEAIEFITKEADYHQNLIHFIMKEIPDPLIGGLLIGKWNRAHELKIELEIDRESSFCDVPDTVDRNHLMRIMSNIFDNAIEAVLPPKVRTKKVKIFLTDLGSDLIFEVEDTGVGLSEEQAERMFELGFSTKAEKNHGFGLALVKQSLEALHGYVTYERKQQCGTLFTVVVPKRPNDLASSTGKEDAEHGTAE